MINVSRVVTSRMLGSQPITVTRRSGGWVNGQFVETEQRTLSGVYGIVTIAQPKDLTLVPEGDRVTGGIRVLSRTKLLQTRDDGFGDIVTWHGARYKVMTVSDDSNYGFYRSICARLEGD